MRLRSYKVLFALVVFLAVATQAAALTPKINFTQNMYNSSARLCILLIMFGCLAGARPLRIRFQAMGMNKSAALANPDYMADRRSLRVWLGAALVAIASLYAPSLHVNAALGALLAGGGLLTLMLVADRLGGWTNAREATR